MWSSCLSFVHSTTQSSADNFFQRPPPPEAEWWDQPLLPNKRYVDIADLGIGNLNIRTDDSPITIYIQHPIAIPAPGDKNGVALKPQMLTKKERKKIRKLKRAENLQDHRDRVAMGLIPPDPPKGVSLLPFLPLSSRLLRD
jgi:U4/U6 small nuclear ribonucleoprotein PRP3